MCHQSSASSCGNRGCPSGTNLHTRSFHSICPVLNGFRNAKAFFQNFFSLEKKSSYLDLIKIPTSSYVAMRFISRRYRHLIFPCTSRYVPKCLIFKGPLPLIIPFRFSLCDYVFNFSPHCHSIFPSRYVPNCLFFQRYYSAALLSASCYVTMCLFCRPKAIQYAPLSMCLSG
jgi:hypothetical protein